MPRMTDAELYAIIQKAYGDPMPEDFRTAVEMAYAHTMGDGLAGFMVIEMLGTTEGEYDRDKKLKLAIAAMEDVGEQVGDVLDALNLAYEADHIKPTAVPWLMRIVPDSDDGHDEEE